MSHLHLKVFNDDNNNNNNNNVEESLQVGAGQTVAAGHGVRAAQGRGKYASSCGKIRVCTYVFEKHIFLFKKTRFREKKHIFDFY